jgi:hypothetical protein
VNNPNLLPKETPQETSDKIAEGFFRVKDEESRRHVISQLLIGAVELAGMVPLLFYLRFKTVGPLGWGTTTFFVVYCLLAAIGLYFNLRTEYHSPVPLRGGWVDRLGAFWLVSCAFGPFFGWIITTGVFPITLNSWRWLYGLRIFLAAGLPVITALPLTRYLRGKSTWIALPLLVCVTLLPISSAMNVSLDLWEGPVAQQAQSTGQSQLYLKHTERSLEVNH